MSSFVLGKSQLEILQLIFRKRGHAYGASICTDLLDDGQPMNLAQVYGILGKLVQKGFVKSKMSEPVAERGGRRKKLYEITGEGEIALSKAWEKRGELKQNGGWVPV